MKRIITCDALLIYPDSNKSFDIHTDANKFQIGSEIIQDGEPIAFYSRKLTKPQRRYTLTENELLSILETLQEFHMILLGQRINIYKYNKNLMLKTSTMTFGL